MRSGELSYDQARETLAQALLRDADLHDAGRREEIGADFNEVYGSLPDANRPENQKFDIATTFWDCWMDATHHASQYPGIEPGEWPEMARIIAEDLRSNRDISDPRVLANFKLESPSGCLALFPAMFRALFSRRRSD